MKMKSIDKHANEAMKNYILGKFLKKKKEPFFKGYKPKYYFEINPIRFGDENE